MVEKYNVQCTAKYNLYIDHIDFFIMVVKYNEPEYIWNFHHKNIVIMVKKYNVQCTVYTKIYLKIKISL